AGLDHELLVFAIDQLAHALDEEPFGILFEDGIPLAAPQNFDHVPASAAESGFKLLDDLSVAADGAVEALKIAIDDENQVVEIFTGSQGDGAERFRFVSFAVAEESPDFGVGFGFEAAIFQVAGKARLINGHQRAEAHRYRRELPEIGHEPRVRVGRKATTRLQLAAEILEFLGGKAAFQERARIDARRGVTLEVDGVPFEAVVAGAEEMVEANFVQGGGRGKRRDMSANVMFDAIRAHHHGQGVPAHQALDAALDFLIAGEFRFQPEGHGVGVRGIRGERKVDAGDGGVGAKALEDFGSHFGAAGLQDGVEGFKPLLYLEFVHIVRLGVRL